MEGYHRAPAPLPVTVHPPSGETITGVMLGTLHDRGAVLHYRISVGDGLFYLARPSWVVQLEAVA
jgi:hypothetical protein